MVPNKTKTPESLKSIKTRPRKKDFSLWSTWLYKIKTNIQVAMRVVTNVSAKWLQLDLFLVIIVSLQCRG